jgi:hypothetical protein
MFCCAATGCFGPRVVGNGVVTTEERDVSDFDALAGSGVGTFRVTRSAKPTLKVTAEENLLPYVLSEVKDNTLRIREASGSYDWHGYPEFDITVDELRSVELSGQTSLTADEVEGEEFEAKASGQCSLTVGGEVESQAVELSGQCTYDAENLKSRKTTVHCSGQCSVVVAAGEELEVEASGMCTVEYVGKPGKLTYKTSGMSKVIQRK